MIFLIGVLIPEKELYAQKMLCAKDVDSIYCLDTESLAYEGSVVTVYRLQITPSMGIVSRLACNCKTKEVEIFGMKSLGGTSIPIENNKYHLGGFGGDIFIFSRVCDSSGFPKSPKDIVADKSDYINLPKDITAAYKKTKKILAK
jgi:hypothetical protein